MSFYILSFTISKAVSLYHLWIMKLWAIVKKYLRVYLPKHCEICHRSINLRFIKITYGWHIQRRKAVLHLINETIFHWSIYIYLCNITLLKLFSKHIMAINENVCGYERKTFTSLSTICAIHHFEGIFPYSNNNIIVGSVIDGSLPAFTVGRNVLNKSLCS